MAERHELRRQNSLLGPETCQDARQRALLCLHESNAEGDGRRGPHCLGWCCGRVRLISRPEGLRAQHAQPRERQRLGGVVVSVSRAGHAVVVLCDQPQGQGRGRRSLHARCGGPDGLGLRRHLHLADDQRCPRMAALDGSTLGRPGTGTGDTDVSDGLGCHLNSWRQSGDSGDYHQLLAAVPSGNGCWTNWLASLTSSAAGSRASASSSGVWESWRRACRAIATVARTVAR